MKTLILFCFLMVAGCGASLDPGQDGGSVDAASTDTPTTDLGDSLDGATDSRPGLDGGPNDLGLDTPFEDVGGGLDGSSERCGNGVVDPDEVCDVAIEGGVGACPTACGSQTMCSAMHLVGEACQRQCEPATVTECVDADDCCPSACDALTDTDCLEDVEAYGNISLGSYLTTAGVVSTANASFIVSTTTTSSCSTTTEDNCILYECPTTGPTPTIRYLPAGAVTITGGSDSVRLTQNADGTHTPFRRMGGPVWSAGTSILASTTGGTVPSFTLRGTFPGSVNWLSPTPLDSPTGLRISASRSSPIRATWSGESGGEVRLALSQVVGSLSRLIACTVDASARSGEIPVSMLRRLVATGADGTSTTFFSLSHAGTQTRTLAGTTLVTLYMNGTSPLAAFVDLR